MTFWGIIITETKKHVGEKSGMSEEKMLEDQNLFSGVRIVLVEPSHPGNIGASARAMKNMGLKELVLVKPFSFLHHKLMLVRVMRGMFLIQQKWFLQ